MRRRALFVPLCMLVVACSTPKQHDRAVAPSRDLLLAEDIVLAHASDVYEAIAQLRPEFLRTNQHPGLAASERDGIKVYLDNMELGGVDQLRAMPVDRVTAIRYVAGGQATLRWGPSHGRGAILVSTSRTVPEVTP